MYLRLHPPPRWLLLNPRLSRHSSALAYTLPTTDLYPRVYGRERELNNQNVRSHIQERSEISQAAADRNALPSLKSPALVKSQQFTISRHYDDSFSPAVASCKATYLLLDHGLPRDELNMIITRLSEPRAMRFLEKLSKQLTRADSLVNFTLRWRLMAQQLHELVNDPEKWLSTRSKGEEQGLSWSVQAELLALLLMFHSERILASKELMRQVRKEISDLREDKSWHNAMTSPSQIRLLLWRCTAEELRLTISRYFDTYKHIHPTHILIFVQLCRKNNLQSFMAEMISKLPPELLADPALELSQACEYLLYDDQILQTPDGPAFSFLTDLLKAGLKPNASIYAGVIKAALASNYASVGWDLFSHLKKEESTLAPHVYVALLRHAFMNQSDDRLQDIMSDIHLRKDLHTNQYIIIYMMNIVRYTCYNIERMGRASQSLPHLMALYDRAYLRDPLVELGIVKPLAPEAPIGDLSDPSPDVLAFTLWAYILSHRDIVNVNHLWARLRSTRVYSSVIQEALHLDVVYNAFILQYCRNRQTLPRALQVLQYMLAETKCKPNSRTWSIIVCGFIAHGEHEQARHLFDLMTTHGFSITHIGHSHLPAKLTFEQLQGWKKDILNLKEPDDIIEFDKGGPLIRAGARGSCTSEKGDSKDL